MTVDATPDRVTRALDKMGLGCEPNTRLTVKTEAKFIEDWVALFGRPPSKTCISRVRDEGRIK